MNKYLKTSLIISIFGLCLLIQNIQAMPNPWTDCNTNFKCAEKASGTTFPIKVNNYQIRAMKNMIEINFALDKSRIVEVRKSDTYIGDDISGNYTKYPINRKMKLKNGVIVNIRGNFRKIYVMNMSAETGYYSAYCEKGMTKKDIENIYEIIREAEEPKF